MSGFAVFALINDLESRGWGHVVASKCEVAAACVNAGALVFGDLVGMDMSKICDLVADDQRALAELVQSHVSKQVPNRASHRRPAIDSIQKFMTSSNKIHVSSYKIR